MCTPFDFSARAEPAGNLPHVPALSNLWMPIFKLHSRTSERACAPWPPHSYTSSMGHGRSRVPAHPSPEDHPSSLPASHSAAMDSSPSLLSLPPEIFLMIVELLCKTFHLACNRTCLKLRLISSMSPPGGNSLPLATKVADTLHHRDIQP